MPSTPSSFDLALEKLAELKKDVPVMSIWRHTNGTEYRVLHLGLEESDLSPRVMYVKEGSNEDPIWSRDTDQFTDGRFTHVRNANNFEVDAELDESEDDIRAYDVIIENVSHITRPLPDLLSSFGFGTRKDLPTACDEGTVLAPNEKISIPSGHYVYVFETLPAIHYGREQTYGRHKDAHTCYFHNEGVIHGPCVVSKPIHMDTSIKKIQSDEESFDLRLGWMTLCLFGVAAFLSFSPVYFDALNVFYDPPNQKSILRFLLCMGIFLGGAFIHVFSALIPIVLLLDGTYRQLHSLGKWHSKFDGKSKNSIQLEHQPSFKSLKKYLAHFKN